MARAQELTLNTLILAALAVIILVISAMLIHKYVFGGIKTLDDCENRTGTCEDVPCEELELRTLKQGVCEDNKHCCQQRPEPS